MCATDFGREKWEIAFNTSPFAQVLRAVGCLTAARLGSQADKETSSTQTFPDNRSFRTHTVTYAARPLVSLHGQSQTLLRQDALDF